MTINIPVSPDYKLTSDERNIIVKERYFSDPTKAPNWAKRLAENPDADPTPEEKVRELYNNHRHEAACSFTDEGTNLSLGKAFGIKEASKVFGVDVEGWDEFDNV